MPLDEAILGFSNRWYKTAMQEANSVTLEPSLRIRVVNPACFVATKLEAFRSRARGDYFGSRDLEDLISVVDGRPELLEEIRAAPKGLKSFVATELNILLREPRFIDALPGHLLPDTISQARIGILLQRLKNLSISPGSEPC